MTENQLKFLNYQESVRHNQAVEADTDAQLAEQARANLAREEDVDTQNAETHRANFQRERLQASAHNENVRHNQYMEGMALYSNINNTAKTAVDLAKLFVPGKKK